MSTYLLMLGQAVWDWVLAPPLHWALGLPLEWKLELGALLFCAMFWRLIIEHYVISIEELRAWWAEKGRIGEWYAYARMPERNFRELLNAMRRRADRLDQLADRFDDRSHAGLVGRVLWNAAGHRRAQAEAQRNEAERLERLWQAIEKERGGPGDKAGMRKKVLRLMRRLDAADRRAAQNALDELNRIGAWFDWDSLAPSEMTAAQRSRLVQLLRLMAGTNSLGEARNAYTSALKALQDIDLEWEWLMA